jgi:glycosyltransferase involved in cell wall biosynthesis
LKGAVHQDGAATAPPVFHVVTPCLNIARYISETIESVVSQSGRFTIRYHIQDGGSSDGTLEIARRWRDRIRVGDFPLHCDGVQVTVESRPDAGMYQAIAKGFRRLAPAPQDLMTWINGDDRLAPGALSTVAGALRDLPLAQVVGGRHTVIDARGKECGGSAPIAYPRPCIAAGLHDGRYLPFIQQEGTFWRTHLWERTGGVDTTFKLAGDFDLWRRFAAVTEYITLDAVTGLHRQHPDQLSADLDAYYGEIDKRSTRWARQRYQTLRDYRSWREGTQADGPFSTRIARRDASTGQWALANGKPPAPTRKMLQPFDGDWAIVSGFDDQEGPFPELGLDRPVRWIVGQPASLTLFSGRTGQRTVSLLVRSMLPGQQVEISIGGKASCRWTLHGRFQEAERLTVVRQFERGPCRMDVRVDRWMRSAEGRQLGVMLEAVEVEPPADSEPAWIQALDLDRVLRWLDRLQAGVPGAPGRVPDYMLTSFRRVMERGARALRRVGTSGDARALRRFREESDPT